MKLFASNPAKLITTLVLCQGAGIIGSFFTISSIKNWYQFLNKPTFSPPNWLFGPVWTILYALMAISLFLVWKRGLSNKQNREAFYLFLIHLFFNAIWSILFFGLRCPLSAFLDIILLWFLIIILIIKFYKISKTASLLLIPYLLWVSFASILNLAIVLLN